MSGLRQRVDLTATKEDLDRFATKEDVNTSIEGIKKSIEAFPDEVVARLGGSEEKKGWEPGDGKMHIIKPQPEGTPEGTSSHIPSFDSAPVKDAKVRKPIMAVGAASQAKEAASGLPDGVSLSQSGYAARYRR